MIQKENLKKVNYSGQTPKFNFYPQIWWFCLLFKQFNYFPGYTYVFFMVCSPNNLANSLIIIIQKENLKKVNYSGQTPNFKFYPQIWWFCLLFKQFNYFLGYTTSFLCFAYPNNLVNSLIIMNSKGKS